MALRMLETPFFRRDPVTCARELIGAELNWGRCSGRIVEVEAYAACADEACHTFFRPSAREFVEQNKAGAAYVYFSYGMHWMLNALVTGGPRGFVLIRALEPQRGIDLMQKRRGVRKTRELCSGPGKLTQALDITERHHKMSLVTEPSRSFWRDSETRFQVVASRRIGITKSPDLPWRFTLRDSPFLSARVKL